MSSTAQTKFKLSTISIISSIALSACGGGSDTPTQVSGDTPIQSGELRLAISGLPDNVRGKISVTGPNGYQSDVSSNVSLNGISTGTYTITILPVTEGNLEFDVIPSQFQVEINDGQVIEQNVTYMTSVNSEGTISNFGSVYVNGVRYDTDESEVYIDDEEGTEDDLDKGMNVIVKGRMTADGSSAIAESIEYDASFKGPIEAISLTENFIVVLGQTIFVDDSTEYKNTQFTALLVGDVLEISALKRGDENFLATHIEKENDGSSYEINGMVTELNEDTKTFRILSQVVDYSNATIIESFANGDYVEVESRSITSDNIIIADSVEIESQNDDEDENGYLSFRGEISERNDLQIRLSGGEQLSLNDDSEIENGNLSDLIVGTSVVIKAQRENGNLIVDELWIISSDKTLLRSEITGINSSASTVELLGETFKLTSYTTLKDNSSAQIRRMTIDDLGIGDEIEILSLAQQDDISVAHKLTRYDSGSSQDEYTEIEGYIESLDALSSSFTVHGLEVSINASSQIYLDESHQYLNEISFFEFASIGDEVETSVVRIEDGSLIALFVELESENENDDTSSNSAKIEGTVTGSLNNGQFQLSNRTILIDENTRFEDGGINDLIEGTRVEVRVTQNPEGLYALEVEFEDSSDDDGYDDDDNNGDDDYSSDNKVEVYGAVENLNSTSFVIRGLTVLYSQNTIYDDGRAQDLVNGALVEVSGQLNSLGELVAREIDFEEVEDNEREFEGVISSIVSDTEFYIGDRLVRLSSNVEFDNGNALKLAVGIFVEVEGYLDSDGVFVAREVEFKDENDDDD